MELAPGRVIMQSADRIESTAGAIEKSASAEASTKVASGKVTPLAPSRFGLQVTITRETREKLRRAQELMAHTTHPRDVATVLDRALDALITELEKRKLAATERPRGSSKPSTNPRQIPADVKRAVRARDGDRCAYVAKDGHRCEARSPLEFDHVVPVAHGGTATIDNVRQLCRTHNRLEAERRFGREFMRRRISVRQQVSIAAAAIAHQAARPV